MRNTDLTSDKYVAEKCSKGFSLIELLITMTITILVLALAFGLLASSLNQKVHEENQASVLADATLALDRMGEEIVNGGFGLRNNGIVAAESGEETIRVRANLNALMKQTTSNSVTDRGEDVAFMLVTADDGFVSLVRLDIATGVTSILASSIDNRDINNDGDGDGLTFTYFDAAGAEVAPQNAYRVGITLRLHLPQVSVPGAQGYRPEVTKVLTENIVLRNTRFEMY
jgi:type II secretory pathway pseudopilin PulG